MEKEKINEPLEHNPNIKRVCAEKGFKLSEERDSITKRFGLLNGDHIAMLKEVLRIVEKQDKEFLKRLKEKIKFATISRGALFKIIDDLAGDL